MSSSVSVSIVSFNNRSFIGGCLDSVMRQDYPASEVVLVDNASTDGTVELVRENYPGVRVIANPENELFCRAQNTGIRSTTGDYALVLNSDVVLDTGFLSAAVAAMESDPKVGSVTGRVLRTGGGVIDTTGLSLGRDRRPVDRGYGEPDDGRYAVRGYVFGAGGVCPLYRRAMLDDIAMDGEYFDESYGAFYEDLDLAWRADRRGWRAFFAPGAVAYHQRGATARTGGGGAGLLGSYAISRLPDSLKARVVVNRYLTMVKNDSLAGALFHLPWILFYDIKLWMYLVFFAPRAIPGVLSGMKLLPLAWQRRKLIHGD
jgi:GT2 family glycosyltransferase